MRGILVSLSWILVLAAVQSMVIEKKPVPTDVHPYIKQLHIQSDIRYRFSTTIVKSRMVNPDDVAREVIFDVTLPNEAFMTNFTLEIDGKIYVGEVKEKAAAKKQFVRAKAIGQSAGHISAKPRETNKFNIDVNLAAKGTVYFVLTYQELLRRKFRLYKHVTYINPGQLVEDFKVEVTIQESRAISKLDVLKIKNDLLSESKPVDTGMQGITINHDPTSKSAYILYKPTLEQQKRVSEKGVSEQFVVKYGVNREENAGELLLVNGYFVHYFAVDSAVTMPKDILFVLDTSTSMGRRKIIQLRDAMLNILDDLQPKDKFNIMTFSSYIKYWKPNTLVDATTYNIYEAKTYIKNIRVWRGSYIYQAVGEAIKMLRRTTGKGRAPVLIFLTDGQPTVGVTNTNRILTDIERYNKGTVPIFGLAFGRGADYTFVKKLAAQNNGIGRKIYEDSDAYLQIEGFYDEISTVLLKNVTFHYLNGIIDETSVTNAHFNTYFKGTELILAGKLADENATDLGLTVQGEGAKGNVTFNNPSKIVPNIYMNFTGRKEIGQITEKLWAYLTIKKLLKEKEATSDFVRQYRLKKKILEMSLKYNFVTPFTSIVVTLPDSNKQLKGFLDKPLRPRPFLRRPVLRTGILPRRQFTSNGVRFGFGMSRGNNSTRILGHSGMSRGNNSTRILGNSGMLRGNRRPGILGHSGLGFSHSGGFNPSSANENSGPHFLPRTFSPPPLPPPTTFQFMTLPTTSNTTTTTTVPSSQSLGRSIMMKVAGKFWGAFCLDFELQPGRTYTLLDHPDIIVEATGSANTGHISKITTKAKGTTLVFFPSHYTINGVVTQYNTGNTFELEQYILGFRIGVIYLKNSLMFYIKFPGFAPYKLKGLLGRNEDVKVNSFNQINFHKASFRILNMPFPFRDLNMNVSRMPKLQNPLNSYKCYNLKDKDIPFT